MILARIVNVEFDELKNSFVKRSHENRTEEHLGGSDACQVNNDLTQSSHVSSVSKGRFWRAIDSLQKGEGTSQPKRVQGFPNW